MGLGDVISNSMFGTDYTWFDEFVNESPVVYKYEFPGFLFSRIQIQSVGLWSSDVVFN